MVKIELGKGDFIWIVALIGLAGVGMVYAYSGSIPSVMGHSAGELEVDNAFCNKISGHNCGFDRNDGSEAPACETTCSSTGDCGIQYYCGLRVDCGDCTWTEYVYCSFNYGDSSCRTSAGCFSENDGKTDNAEGLILGQYKNARGVSSVSITNVEKNSNLQHMLSPCSVIGGWEAKYTLTTVGDESRNTGIIYETSPPAELDPWADSPKCAEC